jgi:arsenate reductase
MAADIKKVLFICKNNSGRSQMAEALLKEIYGDYYKVYSGGSDPKEINPLTIEVLKELGIDISQKRSKSLSEFQGREFDYVVTLCGDGEDSCPVFLDGKKYIHHGFTDPRSFTGDEKTRLDLFRSVRDEIKEWIEKEFEL